MRSAGDIYGLIMEQAPALLMNCDATGMQFTKGSPEHTAGFMFHGCGEQRVGYFHVLSRRECLDLLHFTIGQGGKYEPRLMVPGVPAHEVCARLEEIIHGRAVTTEVPDGNQAH